MRRQEVKHLEEEFSSLFSGQVEPEPKSQRQPSSQPHIATFQQVSYTQTQSQEDFLDQVDEVLGQGQQKDPQSTRRQIMLNFKINELNRNCKTLKKTNAKLLEKIRQLQLNNRGESHIQSSMDMSRGDLSMIQHDFVELEQQLVGYKTQLAKYQQNMSAQLEHQQIQLDQLRQEAAQVKHLKLRIQKQDNQLTQSSNIITMLQNRNEELLLELQALQYEKQQVSSFSRRDSFSDRIEAQLEGMIDKLLKELKIEKKKIARQVAEIKRQNNEINELENTIKVKNKKIYELQFALIKLNKQKSQQSIPHYRQSYQSIKQKQRHKSPQYGDSSLQQDQLKQYLPHMHRNPFAVNKKPQQDQFFYKSRQNNSYNSNRMSAEKQTPYPAVRLKAQSPNRGPTTRPTGNSKTFTLMDLLNKEFRICQIQKQYIVCKIVDLYSLKIMNENYENLIPEQIEVYNFSSRQLSEIKVRANPISNKTDRSENNQEGMLYNMAFILDTLLNQVQVVDGIVQNPLELNIIDYVSQIEQKQSKEEKYKFLQELASSIENYCLSH